MKSQDTIDKEQLILEKMLDSNLISKNVAFEVTSELIDEYCKIYDSMFTIGVGTRKKSNRRYARKLASLTLMEFHRNNFSKDQFEIRYRKSSLKCGFVYLVSNSAFPDAVKVGITKDIIKRLNTYQTYDPYRAFKIEHYEFCENVREKELKILNQFSIDLYKGEWIADNREDIKKVLFDYWPKAN